MRRFFGGDASSETQSTTNKPKNILLIIDPQNDFTPGPHNPTLQVPNAENDLKKLATFLQNTTMVFDEIHVSLDSHNKTHIAHLGFWDLTPEQISAVQAQYGIVGFRLSPEPVQSQDLTTQNINIQLYNLADGTTIAGCENIMPRGVVTIDGQETTVDKELLKKTAVDYINKLTLLHNANNRKPLPNTWPDHCIIGSEGWKIYQPLADVLETKQNVFIHEKGTNDLVEMYSIFKAEVTYKDLFPRNSVAAYDSATVPAPSQDIMNPNPTRNYVTELNKEFIQRLRGQNNENIVYVCGEAKTHCVKTSAEDLVGEDGKNVVMLYNVMSDITIPPIFIEPRKAVFADLQSKGVQFAIIDETNNTIKNNEQYDPNTDNYPI